MAELLKIDSSGDYDGDDYVAQGFVTTGAWTVESVWVEYIGVGSGQYSIVKIYKDEGGDPNSGTLIATSEERSAGAFGFSSPPTLLASQAYFLVFEPVTPSAVYIYRTNSSVYGEGTYWEYDGADWTEYTSSDLSQLIISGSIAPDLLLHIDSTGGNGYGQSLLFHTFTTTDAWKVGSLWVDEMWVDADGEAHVKIFKDEGGDPDAGTLIGTSDDVTIVAAHTTNVTFTFSPSLQLEASQKYYIIWYPISGASNILLYRTDSSVYADGGLGYSTDGGSSWVTTDEGLYDARQLKIYGTDEETVLYDLKTEIAAEYETSFSYLKTEIQAGGISFSDLNTEIQVIDYTFQDLNTEIAVTYTTNFEDLFTEIEGGVEGYFDLNSEIKAGNIRFFDLRTEIATHYQSIVDLLTEIDVGAEVVSDLLVEIAAGSESITDLYSEVEAKALRLSDLKTEVAALTYNFNDLKTEIIALRSKWWLKTEIKAGCAARWSFNTEWNPNRFLNTEISAKKPYEFNFDIQTGSLYSATTSELELFISGYATPLRTLFLDYLSVGGANEYNFQLWWARGQVNKNPLKNVKIKAEYINTLDSGGYEVVTCDWLSCKVDAGIYSTVNETALSLGDIPCDSKLDITLKAECLNCSLTRGLVFFRLVFTGDYNEAVYGGTVVYRDGAIYHAGLYDDYTSTDFVCRLYVI